MNDKNYHQNKTNKDRFYKNNDNSHRQTHGQMNTHTQNKNYIDLYIYIYIYIYMCIHIIYMYMYIYTHNNSQFPVRKPQSRTIMHSNPKLGMKLVSLNCTPNPKP